MTGNEYQVLAMRTKRKDLSFKELLMEGALGVNGEAGEVADIVKKAMYHGHEQETEHIIKECGDIMWYIALICHSLGYDLEMAMEMNIDKLKARYPEGFNEERSKNRKDGDI